MNKVVAWVAAKFIVAKEVATVRKSISTHGTACTIMRSAQGQLLVISITLEIRR
jgi:hypothetical protein